MPDVDDLLRRWREAGVIDDATAERIRAYEAGHVGPGGAARPGVYEALIYVGLAVVGVGAFVLMALVWPDLAAWARIAVTGIPGAAALGLGWFLQQMDEPGMQRGGSLAWVLGAALITGCVGVLTYESGWDDADGLVMPAAVAVGVTVALWVILPSHPQLVALGAALGFLSIAVGVRTGHEGPAAVAGVLTILAAAWVALTEPGILFPRVTARLLGGFALAAGSFLVGVDPGLPLVFEGVPFLAGIALIVLSIARASFAYIVFGVGLLFVGFVSLTMQRVPDPVVGALVLMVAGVLLLGAVVVLARWRPWRG